MTTPKVRSAEQMFFSFTSNLLSMNRLFLYTFTFLLAGWANTPIQSQETITRICPDYPQPGGVSAPFAGFVGDSLLVAGGCNFPDVPAADGGKKKYYDTSYVLDVISNTPAWITLPVLPTPAAYGASVAVPQGLICIGGQNAQSPLTNVYLLHTDGHTSPLPALPVPVDNGGAALTSNTLYVTGGNQPASAKALYALPLDTPDTWKRLADYPGPPRIQPIVVASPDALYLIGGYAFDASNKTCTLSTDILKYDPTSDTWMRYDTIVSEQDGSPRCLVGGSGVYKNGRLYLAGGVNYNIFKQAMEGKTTADYMRKAPRWYRFNDDLLVYDLRTRRWDIHADIPGLARAGGILLEHDNALYMICGEIKPGIRSPQITLIPLLQY